jgi:hypothetical protein
LITIGKSQVKSKKAKVKSKNETGKQILPFGFYHKISCLLDLERDILALDKFYQSAFPVFFREVKRSVNYGAD